MDSAVVATIVAAVVSLSIYAMRTVLSWRSIKKALEHGTPLKIGGLNPLAPTIEVGSNDFVQKQQVGPLGPSGRDKGRASVERINDDDAPQTTRSLTRVPGQPTA